MSALKKFDEVKHCKEKRSDYCEHSKCLDCLLDTAHEFYSEQSLGKEEIQKIQDNKISNLKSLLQEAVILLERVCTGIKNHPNGNFYAFMKDGEQFIEKAKGVLK